MKDMEMYGKNDDGAYRVARTNTLGSLLSESSGDTAHDAADSGNPLAQGFQARTTNPATVGDGDRVRGVSDTRGRQVVYPYQIRELISTASVSLVNGTIATLLAAGGVGVFNDLVEVTGSNTSTGAITLSILHDGTVVRTMRLAAGVTAQLEFLTPIPQPAVNTAWQVDLPDDDNSTVIVDATFIRTVA